ncbi:hypothetical protein HMPREF2787_10485 [Corynebacterium sp. HMSC061H03]|nr:hypothetical protein HMPREF2787_10485 [Corynebacterium sp. HMSC061H03]
MRKSLRSLVVGIVSLALTGAAISVAPSASAYAPKPASEVFLAKKKPPRGKGVTLKCAVVNLRNEATGQYIFGKGKDRGAAQRDANNKLGRMKGKGFKLKHCRAI